MIYVLRESGLTLRETGEIFGIGRERVRQIWAKQKRMLNSRDRRRRLKMDETAAGGFYKC